MNRKTIGILAVALIAAIAAFIVLRQDDSSAAKRSVELSLTVKGGAVVGGEKSLAVNKGDHVDLTVTSDVAAEVHVHGIDKMKDVTAGGTIVLGFDATLDGVFPIELHSDPEVTLAKLTVNP